MQVPVRTRRARGSGRELIERVAALQPRARWSIRSNRAPGSARRRGKAGIWRATRRKTRTARRTLNTGFPGTFAAPFPDRETVPTTSAFTARLSRLGHRALPVPPVRCDGPDPDRLDCQEHARWDWSRFHALSRSPVDACPGDSAASRQRRPVASIDLFSIGRTHIVRRLGAICRYRTFRVFCRIARTGVPIVRIRFPHVRCSGLRRHKSSGKDSAGADGVQAPPASGAARRNRNSRLNRDGVGQGLTPRLASGRCSGRDAAGASALQSSAAPSQNAAYDLTGAALLSP